MDEPGIASLPGASSLFTRFIGDPDFRTARFPRNASLMTAAAGLEEIAERASQREGLQRAIADTMAGLTLTAGQRENLDRLGGPGSLAVVTGQQAGIFGGPLYTLLKAFSAIEQARRLREAHPGCEFVPVFWIEDNDHDREEISRVSVLDRQMQAFTRSLEWDVPARSMVAVLRFDPSIADLLQELQKQMTPSDFGAEAADILQGLYRAGSSPTAAFAGLLHSLCAEDGLLLLSAARSREGGLFASVIRRELAEPSATAAVMQPALEQFQREGLHIQAQASELNLFLIDEGRRHKLGRIDDAKFSAGDRTFSHAELLAQADKTPEIFTPNVLLRPLAQDSFLPTAAYVAGPGEIAYAAQLKEAYARFDLPMPAYLLRHSATFIDGKLKSLMEAAGLPPAAFWQNFEDVERRFLAENSADNWPDLLNGARDSVRSAFEALSADIHALDPTLEASLGRAAKTAAGQLDMIEGKIRKAQKRAAESQLGRLRKIHACLYPANQLQERSVSSYYFLHKYGLQSLRTALRSISRGSTTIHQIGVPD